MMTDDSILPYYLQGMFWANLGLSIVQCFCLRKRLDTAKESAEKQQELHIDRLYEKVLINENSELQQLRKIF